LKSNNINKQDVLVKHYIAFIPFVPPFLNIQGVNLLKKRFIFILKLGEITLSFKRHSKHRHSCKYCTYPGRRSLCLEYFDEMMGLPGRKFRDCYVWNTLMR